MCVFKNKCFGVVGEEELHSFHNKISRSWLRSSCKSSLAFLKGSQAWGEFGFFVAGPLMVGHLVVYCPQSNQYARFQRNKQYQSFLTSQPARTSPEIRHPIGDQPWVVLAILLSWFLAQSLLPPAPPLPRLFRAVQARGGVGWKDPFCHQKPFTAVQQWPRQKLSKRAGGAGGRSLSSTDGGGGAGLHELGVTVRSCLCALLHRSFSGVGARALSPSRQSVPSCSRPHCPYLPPRLPMLQRLGTMP